MDRLPPVVFFDLDGTLVDTERVAVETLEAYFREKGMPIRPADRDAIIGRKWSWGVEYLLQRYPAPPGANAAIVEAEVLQRYRQRLRAELPPMLGAKEFVESLAGRCRLICVSGSHRSDIQFALEASGVWHHFERIVGCEDYDQSKPSPEAYLTALAQAGVAADQAIVFEDSEAGVRSALMAGLKVIRVGKHAVPIHAPSLVGEIEHYRDPRLPGWLKV